MELHPKSFYQEYFGGSSPRPEGGIISYGDVSTDPRGVYATPGTVITTTAGSSPLTTGPLYHCTGPHTAPPPTSWVYGHVNHKTATDEFLTKMKAELRVAAAQEKSDTEMAEIYARYFKDLSESIRKELREERF